MTTMPGETNKVFEHLHEDWTVQVLYKCEKKVQTCWFFKETPQKLLNKNR